MHYAFLMFSNFTLSCFQGIISDFSLMAGKTGHNEGVSVVEKIQATAYHEAMEAGATFITHK